MKINRSLLAAVLGLGVAGASQAGTVYITGSTAMRGNAYTCFTTPGKVFSSAPAESEWEGTSASGANYMVFTGALVGSGVVTTISCHWSGSEAGIADVAPTTPRTSPTFVDPATVGTGLHTGSPATVNHASDLAFSDNEQDPAFVYGGSATPPDAINNGARLAVITFKWVRNPGLWTGNNVTYSQVRQAFTGFCPKAAFTGNTADTSFVYVSGRDNGSGTRMNALADAGLNLYAPVNQVELNSDGTMKNQGGASPFLNNNGFSSGGTLAGTLGANTTGTADAFNGGTGFSVIGYLSTGDAATAITAGATELSVNGVPFSVAAVQNGAYSFWGNEYLYEANTTGDAQADTVFANISSSIDSTLDGTKTISYSNMHTDKAGLLADPAHF